MIDRDNYIVIQGWMLTDLKLKGVPLLVYACIYGFSQAAEQTYQGGLEYLADWAGCTERGAIKALAHLQEQGYIEKFESKEDKRKTFWRAVPLEKIDELSSPISPKIHELSSPIPEQKYMNSVHLLHELSSPILSVPPKTPLNKVEITKGNMYIPPKLPPQSKKRKTASNDASPAAPGGGVSALVRDVIAYLNEKTGKRFSPKSAVANRTIKARLNEGYTLDDFRTVIDKKVRSWKNDARMAQYLRPETLFGTKFDGYLNEVERPMTYQDAQNENFDYDGWARTHDPFGRPLDEFGNPYDEEGADESGDDRF